MAFNGGPAVSAEQVEMVVQVTQAGFEDHARIENALKSNHGRIETVINEYLDDVDKFRRKYGGWDESAFSSGRDGENAPTASANLPSFSIDAPVIYGTEPNNFYGAPSRPPSRANNRSPMSRLTDMTAGEFNTSTPSNRQEEEEQLQRAINESLNPSGVQSPHAFPPPPPPLPQQSGVISSNGESSVHFGPANRPDYDPDEWAMVRLGNQESDPDPTLRTRKPGVPVLLRCRQDITWKKHRIGALLMIFHQIPAARNALLQTGEAPANYGNKSDWWQGQPIRPPGQSDPNGWTDDSTLSWTDELHRLMGFLEATERAYGTADVLTRARNPETSQSGDVEKDFFQNFYVPQPEEGTREKREALMSSVEIVALDDLSPQSVDFFGLLDLQISKEIPLPETLYNALDWVFFADIRLAREDPSSARLAWITKASEVFTCRFQGDEGLPGPMEIPETFYLDRYMKVNGHKTQELQMDLVALLKAYDDNYRKEEELIRWVNPQTNKIYDRRVLAKAATRRCHDKMEKIRHRAFWRKHEQAPPDGEGEYYLPDHAGKLDLLPEEARVIAHYEAKIRELDAKLAEMECVMNEHILPERQAIHVVNRKMASLLTAPSTGEKWNPTHKYTLRGVANEPNTVYQLMRGPVGESGGSATEGSSAAAEERWWKTHFRTEDNAVEHTPVFYETVMREACGAGCSPVLVFATDTAMQDENVPLSDALKTFVKLDNRLFKQELLQSNRLGHKRSAGLGDGSQSKRLQRSGSMDSMNTNQASAGGSDDDMRDAPFDNDSTFGGVSNVAAERGAAAQDESVPDLVDIPLQAGVPPPALPAYENVIEMDTGVSPALAQVSLQDGMSSSSPPKGQEMQERPNAQLLTRPNNNGGGGATNGSAANGAAASEEEPLIDLSDAHDSGFGTRLNGV